MLTTLRRIVLEFSQEMQLQIALERMVSQIKNSLNTDCCSIYLADHAQQHFLLMASDGLAQKSFGQTAIRFSEGLVGLVGQREEPINIADARNHQHFMHAPEVEEDDFNAFLGTPIIHRRKVLGILSIQQKHARNFTENEEAFLVTLAAQLANALASAEVKNLFTESEKSKDVKQLLGIAGAPGIALSEIIVHQPKVELATLALQKVSVAQQSKQVLRFTTAVNKTKADFEQLSQKLSNIITNDNLAIFDVYIQLLDQADISQGVIKKINEGWQAESALKLIIDHYVTQFEAIDDSYLKERATDIRDLGNRLLLNLQKKKSLKVKLPKAFILLAEDVTASMLAEYQHKGLKGIVSLSGSANSHAAILAHALELPAIMGITNIPIAQFNHQQAIVDGYSGELFINPDDALISEYRHLIAQESELISKIQQEVHLPTITQDGQAIELQLNAGLSAGFERPENLGSLGIGLYRTEIPFMDRHYFPSEQEQTNLYEQTLKEFSQATVTMRTLDIGGDKSLPYFPITEDNPFLGWRGIRITLDHPEIFLVQVRAMIRANHQYNNLAIMLPMISNVNEVDDAIRLINQAHLEVGIEINSERQSDITYKHGNDMQIKELPRPKIGIMLEVPSVIFQLEELAQRVDFFSVGSNDLTQYLLAVDRNNAQVADLHDAYHPAVLRALYTIAKESKKYSIPLSLCGELAGEPAGALLLLAMGFDKLSMNGHNIARIKWVIRHVDFQRAELILSHTLKLITAKQVHTYLNEQLEQLGLGGFIRAGL
ncbi:phosphoenolpyruvate--protein phosphotransferase [Colwellia sp. 4_MG-2023]|jgi:phosphotransferase system enzyme I (PtsP)|uniref:phosphoenolpyruvate--protein phosphotransferase n=1 Tax=unclassified Colwellia TaxID=196834 RepID=UPI001C09D468|nr:MULTISPECIES: phosphoenolpyruvate--protein phosphotransferase [unclassified Colwellia]MBU2923858.1 phosphoenolpyruvate--protein phosphotransferase [Colwellia sp. C2M11]MDO6507681.1 phosphoenolpyruvate--protein phosphotransferase [Colwellia sp. 5_MG-2023]MDO6555677.1 phosphoenolpyruvate--protein phosphotransferase [Colwellia sp. 4_MG-2023]MDO6653070.1 phosphoenolpyruvate--protein phosphotransferase [Colwellia sp. 3_MG-2023]MDO6665943.1 phosphoenolpyruvate--protein phosphotransferase [Colwell